MGFDYDAVQDQITALRKKQLFFIGGAPKSGTTWLQVLLDQHPAISCRGEGHFTAALMPRLVGAADDYNKYIAWKNTAVFSELPGYPQLSDAHIAHLVTSAIALQLASHADDPATRLIGEKTPDNIRFFPVLKNAFPRSKFIQIVRDGRDCAVSGWFHNLRTTPDWTHKTFDSMDAYVTNFAQEWASDVGAGTHFGTTLPDSYLAIRYEDLVAEPAPVLETILTFLGAPAEADIIADCLRGGSFETLSGGRVRGQENRGSFFRKGISGDWRQHFTAETVRRFDEKAGTWLVRYGYSDALARDTTPAPTLMANAG
ncbi:MAG: sulfotransferase [Aliidongia sp.]